MSNLDANMPGIYSKVVSNANPDNSIRSEVKKAVENLNWDIINKIDKVEKSNMDTIKDNEEIKQNVDSAMLQLAGKASVKKVSGFINIAEYGAIGDGVTSDQTAITQAVADAKVKGYALNWGWDSKTYLTTTSVPDFHKVKHIGNAIIKRGVDLFYINPVGSQKNKIYTKATGGSNTFDGLSSAQPIARVQVAFDALTNYSPVLTGIWEIVLSTGTYANRAVLPAGLKSENPILVSGVDVGGHPNVPTTIISEGLGASAVGITISDGSRIKVSNIKFIGFNGTSSSKGMGGSNGSEIETSNCHFDSCYWGVSTEGRSRLVVPDGIFNNCGALQSTGVGTGAGARSLQLNSHAIGIQNAGVNTNTALFKNCYQAVLIQESSTGHVDWCNVEDCNYGVVIRVNGRANVDGTSFKRNGVDIRAEANGQTFISSNVKFGTGADESGATLVTASGGNVTGTEIISGVELQYGTSEKAIVLQNVNYLATGSTSTKIVYSMTLKAPHWRSNVLAGTPMKKLYFRIFGTLNGTLNNKRVNVRLGASLLQATFSAAENGSFTADGYIYFTSKDAQYLFMNASRHLGTSIRKSRTVGSNVMNTDINLQIEGQVDDATDSILFDIIELGWA